MEADTHWQLCMEFSIFWGSVFTFGGVLFLENVYIRNAESLPGTWVNTSCQLFNNHLLIGYSLKPAPVLRDSWRLLECNRKRACRTLQNSTGFRLFHCIHIYTNIQPIHLSCCVGVQVILSFLFLTFSYTLGYNVPFLITLEQMNVEFSGLAKLVSMEPHSPKRWGQKGASVEHFGAFFLYNDA